MIGRTVDCEEWGGVYQGDLTACAPNPCPPPLGACCLGSNCTLLSEYECYTQGGLWYGADSPCDPNPCTPVPSHRATWGRVKSVYR